MCTVQGEASHWDQFYVWYANRLRVTYSFYSCVKHFQNLVSPLPCLLWSADNFHLMQRCYCRNIKQKKQNQQSAIVIQTTNFWTSITIYFSRALSNPQDLPCWIFMRIRCTFVYKLTNRLKWGMSVNKGCIHTVLACTMFNMYKLSIFQQCAMYLITRYH